MRAAHERAVRATVLIETATAHGAGWIAIFPELSLLVTARHVVGDAPRVNVTYYDGTRHEAGVVYRSENLDFAVLYDRMGPPELGLRWSNAPTVRGARVVIGGHPGPLRFITTEGVVAGAVSDSHVVACGHHRTCVVIDAESEPGNSGGPVVSSDGLVVGMLWGTLEGTSFSLCIHAGTLFTELDAIESALGPHRAEVARGR